MGKIGTPDEKYLEDYIEQYMIYPHAENEEPEYHSIAPKEYDRDCCIIPSELISFLKATQPKEYQKLVDGAGGEDGAIKSLFSRLNSEMKRGTLHVLRNKIFEAGYGAKFRLVYFKPKNGLNPEFIEKYAQNRFAVVRQLMYSKKSNDEIDMAIFINGLPILTIELKNTQTGQTHVEAIKQYMEDRKIDGEKLLEFKRCLVHFAVGTEQVYMTTRLNNEKTRFIPFNTCFENRDLTVPGYKTSYLWEDVLRKDSLLDLIENYINIQINEKKYYDKKTGKLEIESSEAMIFPRYHQRRAVKKLVNDVVKKGVGHRYLIQHSAGSGKSNTITWLAFMLSSLYRSYADKNVVFDCVFVVTDKRVLDRQIQNNIRQYDFTEGEVAYIDENKTAQVLKSAIEKRRRIIVTTLQKFPVIADSISYFTDRKYAIIIDEAHSSQTGEEARQMRKTLSVADAEYFEKDVEECPDPQDDINEKIEQELQRKGFQRNISFFAFTATPKDKTIELFCEKEHGSKEPFDIYSMEDAIKEGFIMDVLGQYMSFNRYYRLVRSNKVEDKEYDKKKTVTLLNSYVDIQDSAIEKKARIMLEQFATYTCNEIQGQARAMLVTKSRLHAVKYKLKFDQIMQEMRLPYSCLVAFSGTVRDWATGIEYTESKMNNLVGTKSIPDALKLPQYRILIVANKYQTGFDEPLLHTMFVDKKLGGTSTVQTLSRLNRTCKGKDSTMVLDFVNDPYQIQKDFQKYYGKNFVPEENETDPNSIYDVKSKVNDFNVIGDKDLDDFANVFFRTDSDKSYVYGILDRACKKVIMLTTEQQDLFRKTARSYVNLYKFLCQIITFKDVELEKMYVFLTALLKQLPYANESFPYDVLQESELESYKVQYQYTANLKLESKDNIGSGMKPSNVLPKHDGEMDFLSNIIKQLNDTYGLELDDDDKVDIHKLRDKLMSNEELISYFNKDNTRDNIKDKFCSVVDDELLEYINDKLDLYNKLSEDKANAMFKNLWFNELYNSYVRGLK